MDSLRGSARALRAPLALAACWLAASQAMTSHAAVLTSANIFPVPKGTVGSGNGTLDFILLTESAGGSTNTSGSFNGDNANTQMPTGNGQTLADESFITSFGELRDFFELNFPTSLVGGGSTVDQIVIMLDVNETGGPQSINLNTFDIWLNASVTPAGDQRNNPLANDLTSAQQNSTNASFAGGTKLVSIDSTKVLAQTTIGAGWPDHAIFTGINPFDPAFADSDRFLLHWTSSDHDNGGESVFLSGTLAPQDIPNTPEPSSMLFLLSGGIVAAASARRRRRA
jgi:hypothetical protein